MMRLRQLCVAKIPLKIKILMYDLFMHTHEIILVEDSS